MPSYKKRLRWLLLLMGAGVFYQAVEKSPADARAGHYDLKPSANNPEKWLRKSEQVR